MASDMDSVEKLFCGKWKYDRDEKFEECMRQMKFPEAEVEYISKAKPAMLIERRGDHTFIEFEIASEVKHDITFKLGEEYVSKDKADPPTYHLKEIATFKDGALIIKAWSQLGGVNYQTSMTRKGDELHSVRNISINYCTYFNVVFEIKVFLRP